MLAPNWVELTNEVVRAAPPHCTVAPKTKLLPFTVSVNAAPPAIAFAGLNEAIAGTGFGFTGALMVKAAAVEVLPLLSTVTWPCLHSIHQPPECWLSTVSRLLLSCCERFRSTEPLPPLENPVPLTVNVKAGYPALALEGEREVIDGTDEPLSPQPVSANVKRMETAYRGRSNLFSSMEPPADLQVEPTKN